MAFVCIHTADWQIGRSFAMFDRDVAAVLSDARLGVIGRIASVAAEAGARHVLVAGDVYDTASPSALVLRQPIERMAAQNAVIWHLLPGNHDPHRPGGPWERLAASGLPSNIRLYLAPTPAEIEPGIVLLPAPLDRRATSRDPTAWMADAPTPKGTIRIGLAHGSIQGFGESGEAPIPIAPDRAKTASLDYLALGDWHGAQRIDTRTWYAGTPEPDRFADNNPGHVLVVTIPGAGKPVQVETRRVAQYRWLKRSLTLPGATGLADVERELANHGALDRVLLRLVLTGTASLMQWQEIDAWQQAMAPKLRHLEIDGDGLVIEAGAADRTLLGDTGELAEVARRLDALAHSDDKEQAAIASRALVRLFALIPRDRTRTS
jgi:DNA repair exonuclease SbcCD nuclease subunit